MSIDHRASIIYGIKISAEERENLPRSFLEKYEDEIYPINSYDDNTEYIVGIVIHSVAEGYYSEFTLKSIRVWDSPYLPDYFEELFWNIEHNLELASAVPRPTYRKFYLVGVIN